MVNIFLNKQFNISNNNYNYFFAKMIVSIFKLVFKIATVLIINQFFDYLIINIICLIVVLDLIYDIYKTYNSYTYIMNDIKNTIPLDISYELDFNLIKKEFLGKVENYGK